MAVALGIGDGGAAELVHDGALRIAGLRDGRHRTQDLSERPPRDSGSGFPRILIRVRGRGWRDYANTIHRTPLIAVVAVVIMRPTPASASACDDAEAVDWRSDAGLTKEDMPLGDPMTPGAVKCCTATSCS